MSTKIDSNHKKDSNHKSALDISRAAPFDSHAVKFVKLRNVFAFNMASAVEGIVRIIHRTSYLAWYPVSSNSLCNRKKAIFSGWMTNGWTHTVAVNAVTVDFLSIHSTFERRRMKKVNFQLNEGNRNVLSALSLHLPTRFTRRNGWWSDQEVTRLVTAKIMKVIARS